MAAQECLRQHYTSQRQLSDAVQKVTADPGKSPLEQLSGPNECRSGVFFICLAACGCDPAGEDRGEKES